MGPVTAWAGRVEILPSLPAFGYSTKLCFPVSLLEEPRVQHTLGYIATIVNHRAEFLLEEALLVAR